MIETLKPSHLLGRVKTAAGDLRRDLKKRSWILERKSRIGSYLASHDDRRLQIGSGWTCLPGWLNVDVDRLSHGSVYMDATQRFPFPDQTWDIIFSEHMIEHLTYDHGLFMLRECHRTMRRGGKIRIATPNLANIVSLHMNPEGPEQSNYIEDWFARFRPQVGTRNPSFVVNHFFWGWGHLFVYDPDTLRHALETAGFADARLCQIGESEHESLRGVESHGKVIGERLNKFETMVMEAVRP